MAKHGSIDDGARRGGVEGARGSRRAASGPRSAGAEGARVRGRHAVPRDADGRAGSHAVDQGRGACRAERGAHATAEERVRDGRAGVPAAQDARARRAVRDAQAARVASQKAAPRAAASVVPAAATAGEYGRAADRYSTQSRRKGPWRVVFWVALVVLVLSLAALAAIGFSYWSGQRAYDDIASENFSAPSDVSGATLADFSVNWDALRAVNPDVVAWVYIPDTDVSYPIVHRDGDDSHYLTHDFNGNTRNVIGAEYGCVMLSGENAGDFSDAVNVIYGHNMANGSMFALLARFTDSATFNAHRTFYLLTPAGNYELTSFAVDRVPGSSTDIVIPNPGDVTAYVQARLDASTVTPDPAAPAASEIGKVFAFSTCDAPDNSYRIITFCSVTDYQPVGTGADDTGAAQVDEGDIANVEGSVEGRVS